MVQQHLYVITLTYTKSCKNITPLKKKKMGLQFTVCFICENLPDTFKCIVSGVAVQCVQYIVSWKDNVQYVS